MIFITRRFEISYTCLESFIPLGQNHAEWLEGALQASASTFKPTEEPIDVTQVRC